MGRGRKAGARAANARTKTGGASPFQNLTLRKNVSVVPLGTSARTAGRGGVRVRYVGVLGGGPKRGELKKTKNINADNTRTLLADYGVAAAAQHKELRNGAHFWACLAKTPGVPSRSLTRGPTELTAGAQCRAQCRGPVQGPMQGPVQGPTAPVQGPSPPWQPRPQVLPQPGGPAQAGRPRRAAMGHQGLQPRAARAGLGMCPPLS